MKKVLMCSVLAVYTVMRATTIESPVDRKALIWKTEDDPTNSWVAFRKEAKISQIPATVIANISAREK